ncbi:phytoene/squalene synthase family protein [Candidatus Saccharibacteria bacterium]|nr:phytoene/squalene synthase family protein [Candidatus Saccharibacteria bacterium]NCU40335.1 phytoene/squalene synthase family protein [Candidatus Saccharibacteria bacterium]
METYTSLSYDLSERYTKRYSTSFSLSSRLFDQSVRRYIYAIYGMVRLADEIVDSYRGEDAKKQLADLRIQVDQAISNNYSHNPLLHAFGDTCRRFSIDETLINPFFDSMAMDLTQNIFNQSTYRTYIYGSAEVVGLMCLKLFVANDLELYKKLTPGAQALGSAYQKVNFLRDIHDDWVVLNRWYFPGVSYDTFSESSKQQIIDDIERDFVTASDAINLLPGNSRSAVRASYYYYRHLLKILRDTPVDVLLKTRKRVPDVIKVMFLVKAKVKR